VPPDYKELDTRRWGSSKIKNAYVLFVKMFLNDLNLSP
jgi:hypothetical protein